MKTVHSLVIAAVLCGAAAAHAQLPPIITSSQPYQSLTGATPLGFAAAEDDEALPVPLLFPFTWFGTTYNTVYASTNGIVVFATNCNTGGCYVNSSFPSTSIPTNTTSSVGPAIGGVWDDGLVGPNTQIRYVSTPTETTIEWFNLQRRLSTGSETTFSITLSAGNRVSVHFGTMTGGANWNFSTGFQNQTGTIGANLLSTCTASCSGTDFVPNRLVSIGEPTEVDLITPTVTVADFNRLPDDNLTFTVNATIRNIGRGDAGAFEWAAYLSRDRAFDISATDGGADIQVASGSVVDGLPAVFGGVTADGGQSIVNVTGPAATTVAPPTGEYYVLVVADSTNVVTPEGSETNNVGSTSTAFVQGVDLVANSISGPTSGTGGSDAGVTVNFVNRGTSAPDAGVPFRILLSIDQVLDSTDFPIFDGVRTVSGGQTINEVVTFPLPGNVRAGEFHYILQIDPTDTVRPGGVIEEASETNNAVASSGKVTITQPDLVAESAVFLDPVTNLPTTTARFGEAVRMRIRYRNAGVVATPPFRIGMVLSTDSSLSLLSDKTVCFEQVGTTAANSASAEVTLNCTLPLVDPANNAYPTGNTYYLFGQVDLTSTVSETNEQNNAQMVGPLRITEPGADLTVSALTAPASAGVGEVVPVTRGLRNLGNRDAPATAYRFYASANEIITTDDLPLSIVDGASMMAEGTVTLAAGGADTRTELVRLPTEMPAGTYYIGCIIDPARTVANDLDPLNNALSSNTMVVAASSLRITNTQLPDAIIGRPYSYRLSATGEQGASTWDIDTAVSPSWMGIDPATGTLTGTPTGAVGAEVVGVTVFVENAGRRAVSRLALRVLPTTSGLEIITASLPAVVNSSSTQYDFSLGAAGGVPPYAWRVAAGTLPTGITLTAAGTFVGAPRNTPNGNLPLTIEVRDAAGGRATRSLAMRLIAPGAITFRTISLPDAIIGQEYLQDIAVANQDGSMLAKPLVWRVSGAVPGGLSVTPQSELITIAGRATQAGTFTFAISVEDNNGRTDSLEYTMTVHPPRYRVIAAIPEVLRPGEAVNIPLSVTPTGTVTYRVVNGALPAGLTLDPAGTITGTVAEEGAEGMWSLVIEARDSAGISGITPFSMAVERLPRASGCSSTSSDWSPMALAAAALALVFRRKRHAQLGFAAAAAVLVPFAASAQSYQVTSTPIVYQPLSSGTPTNTTTAISLPSGFVFPFFNGTIGTVTMTQFGYLAIDNAPSSSTNQPIPHSSTSTTIPKAFIAPWWDILTVAQNTANGYRYQLSGSAPNRTMAFEWNAVGANAAANRISFQVILHETTGRIRFVYSTALPGAVSASVGIQKEAGVGQSGLSCTPSCTNSAGQYPAGQAIDFFRPPDFEITALSAPQQGHAGVAFPVTANVRNRGGRDATGVSVRFYLSADATLQPMTDTVIGTASVASIAAQGVAQATLNQPLPAGLTPGSQHYLFAAVDPDGLIPEESELNNTSAPQVLTIGTPTADLVVTAVSAPTTAMPGATLQISRTFQNAGNADSVAAKYSWFLSDNASASIADRALSVGNLGVLTPAQTDMNMDSVTLPADVPPGNYWIGVCVNFDSSTGTFGGSEITIVNNCFTQSAAIQVSTGTVAIATDPLPTATRFAPYGVRLKATGGNGQYTWEQAGGQLPPGITLSTAGDLVGSPSTAGTFAFDVKVTSATLTDTRSVSVQVTEGGLPLVIVPQSLTAAEFGRVYNARLVAVGGRPPYEWRAVDATQLPDGMGVATDGLLEGRPLESGDFAFEVEVKDRDGATIVHELNLRVVTPTSLSIATAALETGLLGREYLQPLVAVGGTAPYAWSLIRFQELPENVTDAPGAVLYDEGRPIAFPADLGLSIDDRDTADYLSGTPARAGLFALTFKVTDGLDTEDTASVLLRISYRDGLAITTLQLPDAFVGQPYQVRLSHNATTDTEGIAFSIPCVQQAVRPGEFQCATAAANEQLPAGLMLQADGTILGTPTSDTGVYTFLVKLVDARARQDVRAIAVRVRPDFSTQTSSGCTTAGLSPSTLLALAFGALALRRRRR